MRLNLSDGSSILFDEAYCLTTLGMLRIPDDGYGMIHPYTLYQLSTRDEFASFGLMGKVRAWATQYRSNIRNSAYYDTISNMLTSIGLEWFDPSSSYDWTITSIYNDDSDPIVVPYGSDQTAPPTFRLLQRDTDQEGTGPRQYGFSGARIGGQGVCELVCRVRGATTQASDPWDRLMNYTFTPSDMQFLTVPNEQTHMYFGMELELSSVLSPEEFQRINDTVDPVRERWFYFKEDSSVSGRYNRGSGNGYRMEMVTVPMSPKRMRREWKILFKKLDDLIHERSMRWSDVFDMSTDLSNGIHIHVSKAGFVQNSPRDHRHKFRFIAAFNQWETGIQDWLQKVSKRPTSLRDNRYCYVHPGLDGRTLARRLRDGPTHDDRHAACHESNATVEVRIFQGIVDLPHILSCIDFVEAMFEFTQYAPHSSYGMRFSHVFSEFVFNHHRYKHAKEVLAQCA